MFRKTTSLALLFGILIGIGSCLACLLLLAASCDLIELTYYQRIGLFDHALWAAWWSILLLLLGVDNKYSKVFMLVPLSLLAFVGFCPNGQPLLISRSPSVFLQIVNFIFLPVFTLEGLKRDSRLRTHRLSKIFWRGQVAWPCSAAISLTGRWTRGYEEHLLWFTAMVLSGYALLSAITGAILACKDHLFNEWRLPTEPPREMSAIVLEPADSEKLSL